MVRQKVFGLGLSKTGTTSLAAALNTLGIKTIWYPHDEKTLAELRSAEYRLSILEEYDGAVDTPIVPYYAQLDKIYPKQVYFNHSRKEFLVEIGGKPLEGSYYW